MNLSYLSICSGLGGAPLALDAQGFREVACAEIEPYCAAILDHRYGSGRPWRMPDPDAAGLSDEDRRARRAAIKAVSYLEPTAIGGNAAPNLGDFTQIDPSELPPVDMLIGGTPCQAFSFAGLRRGMADARGNLTLAFVELAHGLAETNGTRCALWENVPGVLSDDDNAFGCFLGAFVGADDPLLPSARPRSGKGNDHWRLDEKKGWIPRWPSAGMVAGPRARAAWIIRNAQYFGVPQRRERVFVVVDLGGGPDPAAVLFERKGLQGNPGKGRKARKDVAGPVKASSARRGGREDNGDGYSLIPEQAPVYLGNAEGAPFLTASNLGKTVNNQTPLIGEPVMFKPSHYTRDKDGAPSRVAPPLSADADKGDQDPLLLAPVPFDETQITSPTNRSNRQPGDPSPALAAHARPPAIAFSCKDHGADATEELAPTMRAMPHAGSHANAGGQLAVAFDLRGREGGVSFEGPHDTANIRAASGGSSRSYVVFSIQERAVSENPDTGPDGVGVQEEVAYTIEARSTPQAVAFGFEDRSRGDDGRGYDRAPHFSEDLAPTVNTVKPPAVANQWAVRRLTPVECERLQGVPDGHTDVPWRGKTHAPDGPRYRAIGNGWATPVVAWLGGRIRENWPTPAPAQVASPPWAFFLP